MDDVNWKNIPAAYQETACEKIVAALRANGDSKAMLFVVGQNVDNAEGKAILQQWTKAGHLLGNHTWTHKMYSAVEPQWFEEDVLKNEPILQPWPSFRKYFRFPALKEGKTPETRDRLRKFLADHGYKNGHVTIDASDWYYDARLRARLTAEPKFAVSRYREPYLNHLWNRATYYNDLAMKVVGRTVSHTLLVHYNLINALFLGDALQMFRTRGWDVISAADAYRDSVFTRVPQVAPAGESLIWSLAKETGRYESVLRYPGEDDVYEKPILDQLGL